MVAEFLLERLNMSYANINAHNSNSTPGNSNGVSRGHILRGGDQALVAGLLNANAQLWPLVMGGRGISHETLKQLELQRQQYEGAQEELSVPIYNQMPSSENYAAACDVPRLRVANLPRTSSLDLNSSHFNQDYLPRSYLALNNGQYSIGMDTSPSEDRSV